jgi:chromosome segregation ATPase
MNRLLEKLNLLGVLALVALCVVQWRINRAMHLELKSAQTLHQEQAKKISDHESTVRGQAADLETFRAQLTGTKAAEKDLRAKYSESEKSNRQLVAERDQLKSSLGEWQAAVAARDEQLRAASTNLQALAIERDRAIEKHNEVAKRMNELVAQANLAASNAAASVPETKRN